MNKRKVIIIDTIARSNSNHHNIIQAYYLLDTNMLAVCPLKEKNEMEWKATFDEAGFSRFNMVSELDIHSIIEVYH